MAEFYQPELKVSELRERLSAVAPAQGPENRRGGAALALPQVALQQEFTPKERGAGYHAGELLQFHDETFIRNAYRALLGREPDTDGEGGFLAALRSGQINRLDVLARLRFSPEGMRRGVPLTGVRLPALLRRAARAPVVGPALRWAISLARLPRLVRHINQVEAHLAAQQEQLAAYSNELNRHYGEQATQQAARLEDLAAQQKDLERWRETATATYAEMAQVSLAQFAEEFNGALARLSATQQETADLLRQLERQQGHARDGLQKQLETQDAEILRQRETITAQATEWRAQMAAASARQENFASRLQAQNLALTEQINRQKEDLAQQFTARQDALAKRLEAQRQDTARLLPELNASLADALAKNRDERQKQFAELAQSFTQKLAEAAQREARLRNELQMRLATHKARLESQNRSRAGEQEKRHQALAERQEVLTAQLAAAETARAEALARLAADLRAEAARADGQAQEIRAELVLQSGRVERLLYLAQDRVSAAPLSAGEQKQLNAEAQHTLDAFYVALEDRLRGSRETILERLQVYLPLLRENALGDAKRPVLDLGCGRGEWLELLGKEGFIASGVDSNRVLASQCQTLGLRVTEADMLAYLRDLPDESQGVVTCFHVVEHLPMEAVLQMLAEALRVLQPGGLAIFETPNPRNVLVGSCNFYYDPTHRNPLPSPVLQFMLEARGFARVEVLNLNPSDAQPVAGEDDIVRRFNEYFYGPMDYAAIGWKPKPEK
jgi:O-antigen chain-terminating methyltransferase